MTLSEPRPYKNILKKGAYTAKREGCMALFTFTSVVQILDYVDMNTHYFCCSDLNKLLINRVKRNLWRNTNRRPEYYFWVCFGPKSSQLYFRHKNLHLWKNTIFNNRNKHRKRIKCNNSNKKWAKVFSNVRG